MDLFDIMSTDPPDLEALFGAPTTFRGRSIIGSRFYEVALKFLGNGIRSFRMRMRSMSVKSGQDRIA